MRVITGTARGRKLTAPEGLDVRPTKDSVKEAIFSLKQKEALCLIYFQAPVSLG